MKILFKEKEISFESIGEGSTIVFLHGFMENRLMWNAFSNTLSKKFNVITIDLPGHGESEVVAPVQSMELMADAVKAVLDTLEIKKCMLVGHSMGGYISLAFADMYPDMMSGLVLFHSHAMEDSEQVKKNRERTANIIEKDSVGYISMFIPDLYAKKNIERCSEEIERQKKFAKDMPKQGIIASLLGMKTRTDKLKLLSQIDIPVLFIAGKQDSRIPLEKMMKQVAVPKYAELVLFADAGHMSWIEEETTTVKALSSFAERMLLH